jgi:hypothetical protein
VRRAGGLDRLPPARRLTLKILEQIVDYLGQRGALTPEEVATLEQAGFIRPEAERDPWYYRRYDDYEPDGDEPDEPAGPPARARPGRRHRKRPPLKAPALAARLRKALRESDPHLRALASIAPIQGHAGRWDRIAAVARATPDAIADAIGAAVESGATSFRALWDAIGADVHLTAVREGEHGPAATAYRALMAMRDHREIGKHLWILRRRAMARVYELSRAQDRAAEGVHAVYRRRPSLIGKWIAHEPHPVAYWSFVLLYNAERAAQGTRWEPFSGEHPARRRLPSPADFSRAWARAIQFGGEPAARFLITYFRAEATIRWLWSTLSSPGSPEVFSEDFLRAELASNPSLAAGHGPRLLAAMQALRRLDFEPAQRLIDDHVAAPPKVDPPSFDGPLLEHPEVALFCPGGWN